MCHLEEDKKTVVYYRLHYISFGLLKVIPLKLSGLAVVVVVLSSSSVGEKKKQYILPIKMIGYLYL